MIILYLFAFAFSFWAALTSNNEGYDDAVACMILFGFLYLAQLVAFWGKQNKR